MYCPKCGAKVENTDEFCYKCGQKLDFVSENEFAEKQSQDKYTSTNISTNEDNKKKKNSSIAPIVAIILLVIVISVISIITNATPKNYINTDASLITYSNDYVLSDFSYDISQLTLLSRNCCDINNDTAEEEIEVSVFSSDNCIEIYPHIKLGNFYGMDYEIDYSNTDEENSMGAEYAIPLKSSGKHYLFYSQEHNNIILLSVFSEEEKNSIVIYDLDESKFTKQYSCYFENSEPCIIENDYTDYMETNSEFALDESTFLSYISEVRVELAEEGAHTFLTNQNDIENYQSYDDVNMICEFTVTVYDDGGSIEYENLIE